MNLYQRLTSKERSAPPLDLDTWASNFGYGGLDYAVGSGGTLSQSHEPIEGSFLGYVQGAFKSNGVVFACMTARQLLFSEARFQYRRLVNGRPGALFGTAALRALEKPWQGGTTGDLLGRMIQDADLAGNFYGALRPGADPGSRSVRRLRPDWVTIVLGSRTGSEIDLEPIGYVYQPGGPGSGKDPEVLLPEEVAHFAPIPDPAARFRGMSWLSPMVEEIVGDRAAMRHKAKFFEQGATANMVVVLGAESTPNPKAFEEWVDILEAKHSGLINAYKTLYLGGGADAKVVGADMKQIDFKVTQGHGETRIAAAAGVPPVIVGLSEGLEAATYANYSQARRRFADGTMRPLWRNAAGSLASIVEVPSGAELWYDDRDIPFLQEDLKDEAEIQRTQAQAIRALVDGGYEPESVVAAVTAGDLSRLKHSGLYSVQLQPAGSGTQPAAGDDPTPPGPPA